MKWVTKQLKEVIHHVNTDQNTGLTQHEAARRLQKYGANQLNEYVPESLGKKITEHLKEITMLILTIAMMTTGFLAIAHDGSWVIFISITTVTMLNLTLGIYQEVKAEKTFATLQKISEADTTVIREGNKQIVPAHELVPGDVVVLAAGEIIPADCRIIQADLLLVEETLLTGSNTPVEKGSTLPTNSNLPLSEHANKLYSGCTIHSGLAKVVVVETGENTLYGRYVSWYYDVFNRHPKQWKTHAKTPISHSYGWCNRTMRNIMSYRPHSLH